MKLGLLFLTLAAFFVNAADTAPPLSANALAAKLSALQQDGASLVKLRMEVQQPPGTKKISLQLQIKQRRSKGFTEVIYQVLWPKERMGEAVLLRQTGTQAPTGSLFVPPNTMRSIEASQTKESLFGSDLTYADVLENFFAWEHQAIVGTEVVDRVSCQILESKPGKQDRSAYTSVRSWVDLRRNVPLRVEKYIASGQLARRIDTSRVVIDDINRHVPANLTMSNPRANSVTEMEGSRLKHGMVFTDHEFTPQSLMEAIPPVSKSE